MCQVNECCDEKELCSSSSTTCVGTQGYITDADKQSARCAGTTCTPTTDRLTCCKRIQCDSGWGLTSTGCKRCDLTDPPKWNSANDDSPCGDHVGCTERSKRFVYKIDAEGECVDCPTGKQTTGSVFAATCEPIQYAKCNTFPTLCGTDAVFKPDPDQIECAGETCTQTDHGTCCESKAMCSTLAPSGGGRRLPDVTCEELCRAEQSGNTIGSFQTAESYGQFLANTPRGCYTHASDGVMSSEGATGIGYSVLMFDPLWTITGACDATVAFSCPSGYVLDAGAHCAGTECQALVDSAVCCKSKALCSTLDSCGAGYVQNPSAVNDFCVGTQCVEADDRDTCCKLKTCEAGFGYDTLTDSCTECDVDIPTQWNSANDQSPCGNHVGCPDRAKRFVFSNTAEGACVDCPTGKRTSADDFAIVCDVDLLETCATFNCPSGFTKRASGTCADTQCVARGTDPGDFGFGTEGWGQGEPELDLHRCCDYDNSDFAYVSHPRDGNGAWLSVGMSDNTGGCLSDKCYEKSQANSYGKRICTWGSGGCKECAFCKNFVAALPPKSKFNSVDSGCSGITCYKKLFTTGMATLSICDMTNCKGCEYCVDMKTAIVGDYSSCNSNCGVVAWRNHIGSVNARPDFCYWSSCKSCPPCVAEVQQRQVADATKYDNSVSNCDRDVCSRWAFLKTVPKYQSKYQDMCVSSTCSGCPQCTADKMAELGDFTVTSNCNKKCLDWSYKRARTDRFSGYDSVCYKSSCAQCPACVTEVQQRQVVDATKYDNSVSNCNRDVCSKWAFLKTVPKYQSKYQDMCVSSTCSGCPQCTADKMAELGDFTVTSNCNKQCLDWSYKQARSDRFSGYEATCYKSSCAQCPACVTEVQQRQVADAARFDDGDKNCKRDICSRWSRLATTSKYASKYNNYCTTPTCRGCSACVSNTLQSSHRQMSRSHMPSAEETEADWQTFLKASPDPNDDNMPSAEKTEVDWQDFLKASLDLKDVNVPSFRETARDWKMFERATLDKNDVNIPLNGEIHS